MKPNATSCNAKVNGKDVSLALTVGRVIYGRSNGSDIGDLEDGPVSAMFTDPVLLAETTWNLYQDRLVDAGVENQEAFNDLLDGSTTKSIEAACKKALIDFFPWGQVVVDQVDELISNLGKTAKAMADPMSGQQSGKLPESLESTPQT
jgi:hypothetical protein